MIARALLLASTLLAAGCGGLVALDVDSTPQGAKVFVDDELIGTTPTGVVLLRPSEERLAVTLELLNHKPVAIYLPVRTFEDEEAARKKPYRLDLVLKPR